MLAAATHLVDVLTGTTLDDYGDPEDGTTVAAASVPASILLQSSKTSRLDSDTPRQVDVYKGRVPAGTPVGQGDRLRTADGTLYVVDSVQQNTNPIIGAGIGLDLRRLP
jgi:hypothetical protein